MIGGDEVRTDYRGPSAVREVVVGGVTIRLAQPLEPERMLDDPEVEALNRRDDYMPYWPYLWPGAYLLAEVVARIGRPGVEAIEIGCGLGLAGLVGLARGMRVRFTDYDLAPLAYVARSAEATGFDASRFTTGLLDWREPPAATYDLVLGSDVLYERKFVPIIAALLARVVAPGGEAWVVDPDRQAAQGFARAVEGLGLMCATEPVRATSPDAGPIRGTLYQVTRPGAGIDRGE